MTDLELNQLEQAARRPDYGAKYFKPAVVLVLIEEVKKAKTERNAEVESLRAQLSDMKRFAYEEAPKIAAEECNKQTAALRAEIERLRRELGEKPGELSVKKGKP